jgi:threonine dehydrogenase-like Zn-dependent dehydrogenase
LAHDEGGAVTLNYENVDSVIEALIEMTGGRGPDSCIDAVGMEAHGNGMEAWYDWTKQQTGLQTDRPTALRQVFQACRKGGTVSIPGVYGGVIDKVPIGAAFNKGLTLKMGQTHVQRYMNPLLERIEKGELDPSYIITHRITIDEAPDAYQMFRDKEDDCIKVVLRP